MTGRPAPRVDFARAYVERVAAAALRLSPPAVRRLALPPVFERTEKHAEFGVLELADGSAGLVYLLLDELWRRALDEIDPGRLAGTDLLELVRGYGSPDPLARALAMGAINAFSQHLFTAAGYEPDARVDVLQRVRPGPGQRLGMVGYFPPLVERLRAERVPLTVLELDPERVEHDGVFEVTLDRERLKACQRVMCTATTLLNDSLADLLPYVRQAEVFAVVGPTAGGIPDPLFEAGIDYVAGTRVVDPARLIERTLAGLKWGDAACKYCIGRNDYPGLDALLRRAESNRPDRSR